MSAITIEGDLAKRVFRIHRASMARYVKYRKQVTRLQFRKFMSGQTACFVMFEASSSTDYWAPEMLFVTPKIEEQQVRTMLFERRERLVTQRTDLVNALRSVLYESGHVFPVCLVQPNRIAAFPYRSSRNVRIC